MKILMDALADMHSTSVHLHYSNKVYSCVCTSLPQPHSSD